MRRLRDGVCVRDSLLDLDGILAPDGPGVVLGPGGLECGLSPGGPKGVICPDTQEAVRRPDGSEGVLSPDGVLVCAGVMAPCDGVPTRGGSLIHDGINFSIGTDAALGLDGPEGPEITDGVTGTAVWLSDLSLVRKGVAGRVRDGVLARDPVDDSRLDLLALGVLARDRVGDPCLDLPPRGVSSRADATRSWCVNGLTLDSPPRSRSRDEDLRRPCADR
jgi:hypothetical protein